MSLQKTGKWNAMHVRIAWEIYNHQQKQKGSDKKDNPLVPSTSSTSSLAKATPTAASISAKIEQPPAAAVSAAAAVNAAAVSAASIQGPHIGQKRPASGAPQPSDFLHKRPATDADLLRSQLFAPPRPPNPLDPLNPLLPRPPYLPPGFGPSPLRKLHYNLLIVG